MRISDWSSDVCSSDLIPCGLDHLYPPPSKGRCFRRPSTLRSLSQPSGQPPVFRAATRDGEPLDIRPVATRRWTGGLTLPLLFRRQEFHGALRPPGQMAAVDREHGSGDGDRTSVVSGKGGSE